ncbi:MAG: DNA-processing protein DprA [Bacteroides sp.]|nr:DNA-processing protein DprA [Bacteroides sp.]
MNTNELTYWVTLASMPKMWTKRKNQLFVACFLHTPRYSIADLFENHEVRQEIGVTPAEEQLFVEAYTQLPNNAFMVEDLTSQGYEIIPITSPDYPQSLKRNLKQGAPCVIYVKGNKNILNEECVAIVGSRKATDVSLEFTTNIARKASMENKTVVSGYAKGVDRQALDATIATNGKSVIVLPQGIMTFSSGFKQYYQQIYKGQVVVISTFHPRSPWSVDLAMARNSIIYGLSSEIYAAQSDSKGGTWSGVVEGLKRGQKVFVRIPLSNEKNANMLLIQQGGIGVDIFGRPEDVPLDAFSKYSEHRSMTTSSESTDVSSDTIKTRILEILTSRMMSKDVIATLKIDWSDAKMKKYLRSLPEIGESKISNKIFFYKRGLRELNLFD